MSISTSISELLSLRIGNIFAAPQKRRDNSKVFEVNYISVREVLEEMPLDNELHIRLLGSSLKSIADETLFPELALRGYDLSKLRDSHPVHQR